MKHFIKRLAKDRDGATAIEYGFLGFFIALGAILALEAFSDATNLMYLSVSDTIDEPVARVTGRNN